VTDPLTGQLTAEHGDVLPASVIATTVQTVAASPYAERDPLDAERLARADVAALADAVRRSAGSRRS
jgi:hypothetical protein